MSVLATSAHRATHGPLRRIVGAEVYDGRTFTRPDGHEAWHGKLGERLECGHLRYIGRLNEYDRETLPTAHARMHVGRRRRCTPCLATEDGEEA